MQLVVQAGSQCGQVYKIDRDTFTIGRGTTNDIMFVDPAMSRVHCEIRREGDEYVVEDRHSANGTFVNDEQIELPFLLRPGDTIRLGQTVLLFQEEGKPETAPSAQLALNAEGGMDEAPRDKPWWLIGSVVGIAIIILAVAFMLSNQTPAPGLAVAPTQTVAVVIKPTAAPVETAASTATSVPTVAETATAVLPTVTPTVVATSAPTETAANSATPPTVQAKTYPIPVMSIVLPAPQSKYGSSSPVPFNWIAVDVLDANEQYRVQVSVNDQFTPVACEIRTRETYATIPGEGVSCSAQWQFGQHYFWRVHIIPRDSFYADPVSSDDAAPITEFIWGP